MIGWIALGGLTKYAANAMLATKISS